MSLPKLPWNIYWINLDRRPDRRIHTEHLLKNNKHFRISAVDCKTNFKPYTVISHPMLNPSQHGCTLSHIKAIQYYLNNSNDEYCFIAEDDCYAEYCSYWKKQHFDLLKNDSIEILQMCTTSDAYNTPSLIPETKFNSCTAFYLIRRDIAKKFINNFLIKDNIMDFSAQPHIPIADNIIWRFGKTKLLPMISLSTIDENSSDISPAVNEYENDYWKNYFYGAIEKYLNYWKNLK
jgi:hypothetical protein